MYSAIYRYQSVIAPIYNSNFASLSSLSFVYDQQFRANIRF